MAKANLETAGWVVRMHVARAVYSFDSEMEQPVAIEVTLLLDGGGEMKFECDPDVAPKIGDRYSVNVGFLKEAIRD